MYDGITCYEYRYIIIAFDFFFPMSNKRTLFIFLYAAFNALATTLYVIHKLTLYIFVIRFKVSSKLKYYIFLTNKTIHILSLYARTVKIHSKLGVNQRNFYQWSQSSFAKRTGTVCYVHFFFFFKYNNTGH